MVTKSKFNAKRSNGFASKFESAVYDLLLLREQSGQIKDLQQQVSVKLPSGIVWKCDFGFTEVVTNEFVLCEAKGVETSDYKLKLRLFLHAYPKQRLEVWKGSYQRPMLAKIYNQDPSKLKVEDLINLENQINKRREIVKNNYRSIKKQKKNNTGRLHPKGSV